MAGDQFVPQRWKRNPVDDRRVFGRHLELRGTPAFSQSIVCLGTGIDVPSCDL